jgi:hypothetical protein
MHKDLLGNTITNNCSVVYPTHNQLGVGTIHHVTPKMVCIHPIGKPSIHRKYPYEVLVVDDSKVTLYILKNSK